MRHAAKDWPQQKWARAGGMQESSHDAAADDNDEDAAPKTQPPDQVDPLGSQLRRSIAGMIHQLDRLAIVASAAMEKRGRFRHHAHPSLTRSPPNGFASRHCLSKSFNKEAAWRSCRFPYIKLSLQ